MDDRTPFAKNTFLGWVLFGKIGRSDVVDVPNLTLERDEMMDFTGTRRCYDTLLTADQDFR